jgi:hypothetical protein
MRSAECDQEHRAAGKAAGAGGGRIPANAAADHGEGWGQLGQLVDVDGERVGRVGDQVREPAGRDFMKGYLAEMNTRPQTIGYGSTDPVRLAAWMPDHDTDSYHKITHAPEEPQLFTEELRAAFRSLR